MRYFVVAPDGSQYGPAEPALLRQWLREGRIAPSTMLVEEGTGRSLAAQTLGLFVEQAVASPFPRRPEFASPARPLDDGRRDLAAAWVCIALSFLVCELLPFCAMFYSLRAYTKGRKMGLFVFGVAILALVLQIVLTAMLLPKLQELLSGGGLQL